ncbi:TadE/TadG family type IV pilus assembly protein [Sphingorhabdus sp.]|uniref:TadE/TadG family type IV pilus assembly protein n=1 Tax=Sphingorhabdus sp. TaxID=1902408 RepID=UPI0037C89F77
MKNVEANKVSGVMSRLLKNEEGNILLLFAVGVIPFFGLVGGGVDMSRIYLSQSRMQGACDAGALIGRKTMGLGTWAANNNAANTLAEKLFDQNFPSGAYGTTGLDRSFAESNGKVTGTASVTVPLTLMRVVGQESQVINVICQAELRVPNTDVMFVLDTTGSMRDSLSGSSDSKIVGLQKAVKCFYEALAKQNITDVMPSDCGETGNPTPSNLGNVQLRFGFVPYAVNVNVGRLLPLDYMADRWTYQSREASFTGGSNATPTYQGEGSPITVGSVTTSIADTPWDETGQNIGQYPSTLFTKESECPPPGGAPKTELISTDGPRQLVSQTPTTPVYPNDTVVTRTYQQVTSTAQRSYQYKYRPLFLGRGICELQYRDTGQENVTTTTRTTETILWITNTNFSGWTYKPVTFNVSGLKDTGTNSWRSSLQLPIGTDGANTTVNWNGCIEERQTFRGPDNDPSNDWDPIPSAALDMDIDLVPTKSDAASQWGPMLPSAIWQRYTVNTSGSSTTRTNTRTTQNVWVAAAADSSVTMETVTNNCPTVAKKFQTWTPSAFRDYVNSLATGGNTYHDIGLLWGARIMSPTGIFADLNAPKDKTIERHMVFMTDGETATEETNYSAYGVHWYDRRQTPTGTAPTSDLLNDLTNARTAALCKAIKDKNINLWVVSYGDVSGPTNDRLRACATPGKFVQATSVASLISTFKEIAAKISALRLTQ